MMIWSTLLLMVGFLSTVCFKFQSIFYQLASLSLNRLFYFLLDIIRWCPMIEQIISDGKLLIEQTKVHDSSMGPVSVLLEGMISSQ